MDKKRAWMKFADEAGGDLMVRYDKLGPLKLNVYAEVSTKVKRGELDTYATTEASGGYHTTVHHTRMRAYVHEDDGVRAVREELLETVES